MDDISCSKNLIVLNDFSLKRFSCRMFLLLTAPVRDLLDGVVYKLSKCSLAPVEKEEAKNTAKKIVRVGRYVVEHKDEIKQSISNTIAVEVERTSSIIENEKRRDKEYYELIIDELYMAFLVHDRAEMAKIFKEYGKPNIFTDALT